MQDTAKLTHAKPFQRRADMIYLVALTLSGSAAIIWSAQRVLQLGGLSNLVLLTILAGIAMIATTHFQFGETRIAYEVGTSIGLSTIASHGPAGAIIVMASATTVYWLYNAVKAHTRPSREKLAFNVSMHVISVLLAGLTFELLTTFIGFNALGVIGLWLLTALVYDQTNLWLLTLWLRLMRGPSFSPIEFWRDNGWAMAINLGVLTFGGGLMAFAVQQYDWQGIVIFFLPIALSALAFRLYAHKMESHLNDLESIIAKRTSELEVANQELASNNVHLSHLNEQLSDADRAKDRFFAVLSHDMRSPLTGIMLYSQMLAGNTPLSSDRRQQMTNNILQNAQTLVELVDNLVEVENIKDTRLKMVCEYFDINALIQRTVSSFEAHAFDSEIKLTCSGSELPLPYNGDAQLIKRIMTNLISNAVKYTPEGGTVAVRVYARPDRITIEIADSGYGIPPQHLNAIFDAYHRVDDHLAIAKGTGLGLSIVKHYVEAHGGVIEVDSQVGAGSTFRICLPTTIQTQSAYFEVKVAE